MENDSLNNVIAVETKNKSQQDDLEGKPIMKLFRCLLSKDNKENTVLTNAQILDLLKEEFQISTEKLHELEVDIYLHIVKRFLKEWPKWDEFDPILNRLREKDDSAEIDRYLRTKYDQLKSYLTLMLEVARPRAKEKVKEVEQKFMKKPQETTKATQEIDISGSKSDVILEICCSRAQLNNLFYRVPNPEQNYTVFNASVTEPTRITLDRPEYEAMLNWWNVNIIFKLSSIHLVRSTMHDSNLKLVNKKLNYKTEVKELCPYFMEKTSNLTKSIVYHGTSIYKKNYRFNLPALISQIVDSLQVTKCDNVILTLFLLVLKDLDEFPNEYLEEAVWYRKYFTKYPYVRYLYKELESKDDTAEKYDLQLEEVIYPKYQLQVGKIDTSMLNFSQIQADVMSVGSRAVQLECKTCILKFGGVNMLEQLKQHIWENHFDEPDWQCMKCMKSFSMVCLANNRWQHECDSDDSIMTE